MEALFGKTTPKSDSPMAEDHSRKGAAKEETNMDENYCSVYYAMDPKSYMPPATTYHYPANTNNAVNTTPLQAHQQRCPDRYLSNLLDGATPSSSSSNGDGRSHEGHGGGCMMNRELFMNYHGGSSNAAKDIDLMELVFPSYHH